MRLNRRRTQLLPILLDLSTAGLILVVAPQAWAQENSENDQVLVDEKYSLKADREALKALRKDIPPERRSENDEKAFMDQMMMDLSKRPAEVRSRFNSILSKKRTQFNKDMTKTRQDFTRAQKKEREAFTKEQADARKSFGKRKVTSDERRDFFADLESNRKDFYAAQKEKRDAFEADVQDKRKNFNDYVKSRTDEFNQLHRDYSKRYEENKKSLSDRKKQAAEKEKQLQEKLEEEYSTIKNKEPTRLGN